MTYSIPWDESTPDGSEAANTIDTEIVNLKIAIRERMSEILPDWDTDLIEPKLPIFGYPRVEAIRASNQAIGASAYAQVTFSAPTVNNGTMWSAGNPTRITIPAGLTGFYLVVGYGQYEANAAGSREFALKVNGTLDEDSRVMMHDNDSGVDSGLSFTWMGQLTAGDYLELTTWHNSTTDPLNLTNARLCVVRFA